MTKEEKRMTKEEAIHILEYERDNDIFCSSYRHKVHIAMTMGVEALRQKTVSKETYDHEFNLRKEFEMKVFELERKIAEQEGRPKGEWIDEDGTYYANCSMCGYQMDTHQERGYFRYCPNCGSDNRGRRE